MEQGVGGLGGGVGEGPWRHNWRIGGAGAGGRRSDGRAGAPRSGWHFADTNGRRKARADFCPFPGDRWTGRAGKRRPRDGRVRRPTERARAEGSTEGENDAPARMGKQSPRRPSVRVPVRSWQGRAEGRGQRAGREGQGRAGKGSGGDERRGEESGAEDDGGRRGRRGEGERAGGPGPWYEEETTRSGWGRESSA